MDIQNFSALFNTPARREAFLKLIKDNKTKHIFIQGLEGSSIALFFSNLLEHKQAHILIANDLDEAGYLYNDLVQINGNDHILLFPSGYKRDIKYGQPDPPSEILRTEVLNRLCQKGESLLIVTYPEAIAEKIEAFQEGSDIHAATAAKIYKVPIDAVTADMRRKAKTANFGIIYGISVFGLAERLNIPRSEAKILIDGYFESYPQIKEYMNKSIEVAREKGYVETICGRKRMLPDIHSHNSVVRGYAERNAINAPIQGSAADIIKIAMIRIAKRLENEHLRSRMILQVHDELNFNVPVEEIERVKAIVCEEMENAYPLQVPLLADSGVGRNWLEAH